MENVSKKVTTLQTVGALAHFVGNWGIKANTAEETHKMREAVDPLKPQEWQTLPKK